jgi:hypothetical protein
MTNPSPSSPPPGVSKEMRELVSELYGAFIHGYDFGKCVERDAATPRET